ncbi:MAG: hypothetical protein NTX53_06580 [candidate division WOR-3 bacterium]|nr:hypothetical protein [candidate division WOR-3 bacterium]
MIEQIADRIALQIARLMISRAFCGIVGRTALDAVVETVREIPRGVVLLTAIFAVVWTAFMIVCRTISQTVF